MTKPDGATSTIQATIDEFTVDADDIDVARLVTDDGQTLTVPRDLLPRAAKVGDVLNLRLERDAAATRARRRQIVELQQQLFRSGAEPPPLE